MKFDDDALDAALMRLPLEEPPPGMHASILAATVWREPPAISFAEAIAVAGIAAALAWLGVLLLPQLGAAVGVAFSNVTTLAWLSWFGMGAAVTMAVAFFTESQSIRAYLKAGNPAPRA
jgi:hypothetical protein